MTVAGRVSRAGCTVSLVLAALACEHEAPPPKHVPPPPQTPREEASAPPQVRAPKFTVKNNHVELPGPILFHEDKATLRPESDAMLEIVFQYLTQSSNVTRHRIEGHTDSVDSDAHNMQLSKDRAMTVARWLVAKGIDCKRLLPVGFGESRLKIKPEETEEHRASNRRVEFVNAEIDGSAIGGLPLDGGAGGERAGDACH
jgi:OOP family OmpA-OmpF porin